MAPRACKGQDTRLRNSLNYAHAIKIDAETMLGGYLKEGPKATGVRTLGGGTGAGGTMQEPPAIPTLGDLGLTKKLSSEAQMLAELKTARAWGAGNVQTTQRRPGRDRGGQR